MFVASLLDSLGEVTSVVFTAVAFAALFLLVEILQRVR
jgi:hypothetical protein